MESKVYKYMDWPEIEAVVYAEEASPKDLMAPRLTADGILIQGFFPDAEKAEVLVDKKAYEMEKQDDAGYFAAMIPGRKIPAYQYRITRGKETRTFADPYAFPGQITEAEEKAFWPLPEQPFHWLNIPFCTAHKRAGGKMCPALRKTECRDNR